MMIRTYMKKAAAAVSILLVGTMMVGCGSTGGTATTGSTTTDEATSTAQAGGEMVSVGIIQLTKHPALDAAYEGYKAGLAEAGFVEGENIKYDFNDAQGEKSNCQTIANKLVNNKSDMILAIGTDAALAAANATKDIPVLLTAVTDPVGIKLVTSMEEPGGNVTGTSDLNPCKDQIKLLTEILPEAKTVGMLYTSNEMNSKIQVDLATEAAKELGLKVEVATVSSTNEIKQVVNSLASKVDAIYIPTDNLLANAMVSVGNSAIEAGVPVFPGEENMTMKGGLATVGLNYFELGKQTGLQAAKILKGEATPATTPVEYAKVSDIITVNEKTAKALGITIPKEIMDKVKKD